MSNAEELSVRSKEDGSLDRNDWRNLGMIMVLTLPRTLNLSFFPGQEKAPRST